MRHRSCIVAKRKPQLHRGEAQTAVASPLRLLPLTIKRSIFSLFKLLFNLLRSRTIIAMDISAGMSDATRPGVSRSSSIYSVLSMPDRTRVLRILPKTGRADEEIVVELEEVTLGSMDYQCLSYTWGGPKYEDVGDKASLFSYLLLSWKSCLVIWPCIGQRRSVHWFGHYP
jgi:hypothetical protein